jgi:hypothetical protein
METPMESVTSTLIQPAETLLHGHDAVAESGIPLASSTSRPHALRHRAISTEALEHAARENRARITQTLRQDLKR